MLCAPGVVELLRGPTAGYHLLGAWQPGWGIASLSLMVVALALSIVDMRRGDSIGVFAVIAVLAGLVIAVAVQVAVP